MDQRHQLEKLPNAEYAAFNAFKKDAPRPSTCHPGTRKEILEDIRGWGEGHDENCILWLSGMAGTGKSTIARSVAEIFHKRKRLGASFFFSRGQGLRAEATALVTTLAIQLAETFSDITPYICRAIAQHSKIGELSLSDQWDLLILQPLLTLGDSLLTLLVLIFVIDALDECMGNEYVPEILRLLARANDLKIVQLRILVTSRPELHIHRSVKQIPEILRRDLMLDSVLDGRTERDISIFVEAKLAEIAKTHVLEDWPSKKDTKQLVKRAGRLFIYADTVCRFLGFDPDPEERLSEMLDASSTGHSFTKELDNISMLIMGKLIVKDHDEANKATSTLFKEIVGSIIVLIDAFSIKPLAELIDKRPTKVKQKILNPLRSVLAVPDDETSPVQLFHLSFRDFLHDKTRCFDPQFLIDEEAAHHHLFVRCLDLMENHLRRDICGLRRAGVLASEVEKSKVESCLPPAVRYACQFFVTHLQGAKVSLHDGGPLHMFLQIHFLDWLEALSLTGKTSDGVLAITSLAPLTIAMESPDLHAILHHAKRFILLNQSIIERAPLQIYCAALIFTSQLSVIRR
ncbi:hypothetical protein K432DRAFT_426136 [Lepidopterella palustris CBS 459.81]|uniref:Nephrocystin 3-like N-terminal domain-containing protein n=1 Tax=Lepidopterella palustris CBS 459.81 TaxID=1314670 RepID=A0A8E2E9I9_9PEZI|nr:hypothetical protein K432DRAFT_426136 [Lepidopterella palustris CBS 459.81]